MVKQVQKPIIKMHGYQEVGNKPQLTKRPGRPRSPGNPVRVTVTVTLLRNTLLALTAAASEARTPALKNQLTDAVNGITERLGPAVNPDWQPDGNGLTRRRVKGYRVINPDGTETVVATLATAAALAGLTVRSMAVRLSQGGGKWQRKRGEQPMQVERILA
jgi:hypothetical protein